MKPSLLGRKIRQEFPGIPIVIGGVHCTMVPEEVARDGVEKGLWDYICLGEGEYAMKKLAERIERGGDTSSIPNIWVIRGKKIYRNRLGVFTDISSLPRKDYFLFELERITREKGGWLSMLTSRGCPYRCSYCFNREIVKLYMEKGEVRSSREYLRRYPVQRIMDELRELKKMLPSLKVIIFDDDLFTLHKGYVLDFCRHYRENGIGLPFVVNAHVQSFDAEIARALAEAGCIIVKFGLESGSPRVRREILERPMSNEKIARTFEICENHGLHSSAFIMLGLPTETREELMETVSLCGRVKMGRFRWALFFPFPGTRAHAIAEEKGLIDREKMEMLGNYFEASCLKFDPAHDLLLEKMATFCHWWVNARTGWPGADTYGKLLAELEEMDRHTFVREKQRLLDIDKEVSAKLMEQGILHYSLRYSNVMGVRSDYIAEEMKGGIIAKEEV